MYVTNGSRGGSNSSPLDFAGSSRVVFDGSTLYAGKRGSETYERRRERGGLYSQLVLSPKYDLGGEQLRRGGWKQAYLGEFCFPVVSSDAPYLVLSLSAHGALQGCILVEEKWRGKCHFCLNS